jgi:hypothetical protein
MVKLLVTDHIYSCLGAVFFKCQTNRISRLLVARLKESYCTMYFHAYQQNIPEMTHNWTPLKVQSTITAQQNIWRIVWIILWMK